MTNGGQYILLIPRMNDRRMRRLTAEKLARLFRTVPCATWRARLESGAPTVVMRSDSLEALEVYRASLELVGAELQVAEQHETREEAGTS